MKKYALVSLVRIAMAVLALAAIVTQLAIMINNGSNLFNFFSFFTIESNILAASLLAIQGIAGLAGNRKSMFEYLRGAAVLYMCMTGIIYVILLADTEARLLIPWVNTALHYIMPVAVLIDWLVNPPTQAISYKKALGWLLFPTAYLIYSFIRGSIVNWYPYPFLDPAISTWSYITGMCVAIMGGVLLLTWLLTRIHKPSKSS